MTDIRTAYTSFDQPIDWLIDGADLADDRGLETAVVLSLFTDRRADDDDRLPDQSGDRRGWWGDAFPDIPADQIGSRLWLLHREKQTRDVVLRAREYASEALAWLIDDGVAAAVRVDAYTLRPGVLAIEVEIDRPGQIAARFQFAWEAQDNAV